MYSPSLYKYRDSYVLYIPTVHTFGSVFLTHTLLVQTHTHMTYPPPGKKVTKRDMAQTWHCVLCLLSSLLLYQLFFLASELFEYVGAIRVEPLVRWVLRVTNYKKWKISLKPIKILFISWMKIEKPKIWNNF